MTDEQRLTQERNELNLLIDKGVTIELDVPSFVKPKGWLRRLFRKRKKVIERMEFRIQELTLTTLDLLSIEQIELAIDEQKMQTEEGVSEAKRLAKNHSLRMARIVAIAVLGQDYFIPVSKGNHMAYRYDEKRLNELTNIFYHNMKPSNLLECTMMITTMSNLGDFINSIRLMSAARTTMPILVEEGKKA